MEYNDYQLRHAAGRYWLLNVKQRGLDYIRPLCLNECGAYLWKMLCEGLDKITIADRLCDEFGLERGDALKDVEDFLEQLNKSCSVNSSVPEI